MRSIVLILIIFVCVCSGACSKRGIAYTFPSEADMAAVSNKISWWYNWASNPATAEQNYKSYGLEYVPMIWGSGALQNRIPSDSKYLLGFNEPNFVAQSNLPAATAASLWSQVEDRGYAANANIKILSPAVNYCGGSCVEVNPFVYLDNFFANCQSRNCKVDYIAVHWYACTVEALKWYVDQFRKYNKKIWVTEISCAQWDGSWQDSQQFQIEYMKKAVAYLENEPLVIRYAWFSGRTSEIPYVNLFGANGQLTDLGNQYLNQPCQENPINPPPPAPPSSSIPVSCSTKFNVDFWGSDISNKAVSSILDCCAYCKSISNCAAWTLYNGVCYAKTSAALSSEQTSAGRISGSINQGSCGTVSDIDYNGSDISSTSASSTSSCCSYCGSIPNCQAWTLSNNVCYAKTLSALSNPIPTSGISSGIINSCSTTDNIDYFGSDISQKSVRNPVECCAYCQTVSGCFAWTFNSNTKMCYAKAASSILNAITTSGAVGGVVNRCVWANDIDFFGSDISYKAVSSAAECCAYCQTVSNCAVWTLSEGYCYAKSSNALSNPQQKTGLISGKMTSSIKVSFLTEESNIQSSTPQQSLTLIITSVGSIFIVLIILGVVFYKKYSQSIIISNEKTHQEVP